MATSRIILYPKLYSQIKYKTICVKRANLIGDVYVSKKCINNIYICDAASLSSNLFDKFHHIMLYVRNKAVVAGSRMREKNKFVWGKLKEQ